MFTSSVNVCFSGKPIMHGDEVTHKWLDCKCSNQKDSIECSQHHLDYYSESKQEAEKLILNPSLYNLSERQASEDKIPQKEGNCSVEKLRTCVLRLVK